MQNVHLSHQVILFLSIHPARTRGAGAQGRGDFDLQEVGRVKFYVRGFYQTFSDRGAFSFFVFTTFGLVS